MPHFAIVIRDPKVAREREIARNVAANHQAHALALLKTAERERLERVIVERVSAMVGPERQAGELHASMVDACPDGLPNCRNCGDPAFAESCAAAGHCPYCGTRHGIAPASVLEANGYELVEVDAPAAGEVWDSAARRFTARG